MKTKKYANKKKQEEKKKGRKPLSIPYIFEKRDYLTVLTFIYHCHTRKVKQKRRILDLVLVKRPDGKIFDSSENQIVKDTYELVNSVLFVNLCREYEKGYISKEELKAFADKDSLEDFLDNLFETKGDLSKRLKYLSTLGLIEHIHEKTGTYWDISKEGQYRIDEFKFSQMLDTLIRFYPDEYKKRRGEIFKLLSSP